MTDSVFSDAACGVGTRKQAGDWSLFLLLVSLASLLPFAIAPLASHVVPKESPALYTYTLMAFLGSNAHVASTGWFYTDPQMRGHFRSHPLRYVVIPIALVLGSAAAFHFLPLTAAYYIVAAFVAWQLWHYQKQNVGLLSFIAAGTGKAPLSAWERRTLMLSAIAGILGFFDVNQAPPIGLSGLFPPLHQAGLVLYLLVPVAFCLALIESPALRANRLRLAFFGFGALFFAPTFLFADSLSALTGYAIAHGLQYFVFMGFVSAAGSRPLASTLKLLLIAVCGGLVLDWATRAPYLPDLPAGMAIYGAFLGVVMAHFVVDAGVWRLREPFQRGYMREKFHFVFSR